MNVERVVPIISRLNSWARVDYEHMRDMYGAKSAVYRMKRLVIIEALRAGICQLRVVRVERPCKTCGGTGMFKRWSYYDDDYWEPEDCRRCGATGKVTLRFIETTILGAKWHTPRPKAGFLDHLKIDWESGHDTDWTPEQPGAPIERVELIRLLNEAEREVCGDRIIRWGHWWHRSSFEYYLHFDDIWECFVCGRQPAKQEWQHASEVVRPGMKWRQAVCDNCQSKAKRWPRQWPTNLYPQCTRGPWFHEFPDWPNNAPLPAIAQNDHVKEWLARRGIVEGRPVPGEYAYWHGEFREVAAHRNGLTILRIEGIAENERLIAVPAREVTARAVKCIADAGAKEGK